MTAFSSSRASTAAMRTERDSMGTIAVPADRLWGAQTQRALGHFAISGERMAPELIRALAQVKRASACVNHALGLLDAAKTTAIVAAADEVIGGGHLQEFPLVVWQTGSGTHNEKEILKSLTKDTFTKNVVYCSDAGMPCISDPGASLVDWCIQNEVPYDVIPGANAILTAFAMSGFSSTEFTFFGFLDHKGTSRASKLEEVLNSSRVGILYESPHRLLKLLEELNKKEPDRTIFLVKEISKFYQKTYKNSAKNLYEELKSIEIKGEWVVVVEPKEKFGFNLELDDILPLDIAPKIKAKLIAKLTGASVKEIYQELLDKIQN